MVENALISSSKAQKRHKSARNIISKDTSYRGRNCISTYENIVATEIAEHMAILSNSSNRHDQVSKIPLTYPNPPRLSLLGEALTSIEHSGIFSNYGPVNTKFEIEFLSTLFGGVGACVTVANATLGLMIAIKQAVGWRPTGRYALMPSFTFAAAAHAALWCGLTPLFCDIDEQTWLPDAEAEDAILQRYGQEIAVILPNATFGNCLDLHRYDRLSIKYGIPLVIDAAGTLGSRTLNGEAFGLGSAHPLIFSMHATKCFSTGEGGVIYCADKEKIADLRRMGGFGFNDARIVTMPGLNTKLSEVAALLAATKLQEVEAIAEHRFKLHHLYRKLLPEFTFQHITGQRSAIQFISILLPEAYANYRAEIIDKLALHGIGTGKYFSPHLASHPFFVETCVAADLAVTENISQRIISLPMSDVLTEENVRYICEIFQRVCWPFQVRQTPQHFDASNLHTNQELS